MNPPAPIKMADMTTPDTAPAASSAATSSPAPVSVVEILSAEKIHPNGTRALNPVNLTVQRDGTTIDVPVTLTKASNNS